MPQSHDGVVYDGHGVLAVRLPVVRDVQLLEPAIQPKRVAQVLTPSRIKNKLAELGEQVHAAVAALEVPPSGSPFSPVAVLMSMKAYTM